MELSSQKVQKVRNSFESILRADYISLENIEQLHELENYYIDFYNNLGSLLQKQDNFILGRRGTGKTTILLRGYYECLKTISPKKKYISNYFENVRILPIFIDLSSCSELFDSDDNFDLMNIHFVRQIISALKKQLGLIFEEKTLLLFKKENPALDDLEYIEKILIEGTALIKDRKRNIVKKSSSALDTSISSEISVDAPKIGADVSSSNKSEEYSNYTEIRGLNVQEFLDKLNDIRKKAEIDSIYIFLDEFSDLNAESQLKFSGLLKNFLGSKVNLFFKIGTITDRYDFGDKIRIGRDIFPIPLDLNEHVERYGGIIPAIKQMENFIDILIAKRLETFCPELNYNQIFKIKKEELLRRITRETLGVPRTIGLILQKAWIQCSTPSHSDNKIGLSEINYGIRNTRKMYQKQFDGSVKKRLIPSHYMDMLNSILEKAIYEKSRHPDRPASHFMIDPIRSEYLKILCENFLIHLLEENRTSKYGGKYYLYSIDYDICLEYNIQYAEDKDQFTSFRFVYDPILSKYDPYFTKDKLKSFKCPECERIYEEKDVAFLKVKRCFDDDTKLIEIVHKEAPKTQGNYTEVEIKILGLITSLDIIEEAMSAQEIADAVGCSRQKVSSWCSKVLAKKGIVEITKISGKNHYYSGSVEIL